MAILRKNELMKMREPQLKDRLAELKKEMMKINAQIAVGTVENPGRVKEVKKTIACIHTILNQLKKTEEKQKSEEKKKEIKKIEKPKEEKKKG